MCVGGVELDLDPAGRVAGVRRPRLPGTRGNKGRARLRRLLRGDSTALVAATVEERPYLWVVGLWERPDRAPAEWVVDREQVDATVNAAMERYDVAELACDPFGWHAELVRWADAYGQVVLEFPTAASPPRC